MKRTRNQGRIRNGRKNRAGASKSAFRPGRRGPARVITPLTNHGDLSMSSNAPSRNRWISASTIGANFSIYDLRESLVDLAEFPALRYYIEKFGVYPSMLKYDIGVKLTEFEKVIKGFKKEFYTEGAGQFMGDDGKLEFNKTFMCFQIKGQKAIYYIQIIPSNRSQFQDVLEKKKARLVSIVCIFDPKRSSNNMLSQIQSQLIRENEVKLVHESTEGYMNLLVVGSEGYDLDPRPIKCPEIDFKLNYNEDFESVHELIIEKLNVKDSKGLVLLDGVPGSGKTTYIRYLINKIKKTVIYIPPNIIGAIADPGFVRFLSRYPNAVLIVEEAELALCKREGSTSPATSNILNLTDGLLSDCLGIQVVATFNTPKQNIDEALMRKGRLIAEYEFGKLSEDRVKALAEKLGVNISGPQVVGDVYNAAETSFSGNKNKNAAIGFKIPEGKPSDNETVSTS